MNQPSRFPVMTTGVDLLEDYTTWVIERIKHNLGTQVTTLNAEMAMLASENNQLAQIIQASELVIPDGAGITIYLRLKGYRQTRCPGIELASSLITTWSETIGTEAIAFYGGAPGIAAQAAQMWVNQDPQLQIITNHGYLNPEELQQWQTILTATQPKLILVGLGVPRQELWINQNRHLCPHATWIGVGGSFDIWAGQKSRAPLWFRQYNLEWLYRLYQEPWRWRRMLALPRFFVRSLLFSI
ncbi:MAG: glycosyltransferase [Gloeocapsa sp. DLM2.Bin57]|nr:MAG: glycosyltransferase [Gloeocapsa sp. DLM2.Bin57]